MNKIKTRKQVIAELKSLGIPVRDGKVKKSDIKKALAKVEAAWESWPKGWDRDSAKSWWDTVTEGRKHKRTACMEKIGDVGEIDDPGAFCNSLYHMFED